MWPEAETSLVQRPNLNEGRKQEPPIGNAIMHVAELHQKLGNDWSMLNVHRWAQKFLGDVHDVCDGGRGVVVAKGGAQDVANAVAPDLPIEQALTLRC